MSDPKKSRYSESAEQSKVQFHINFVFLQLFEGKSLSIRFQNSPSSNSTEVLDVLPVYVYDIQFNSSK